MFESFSIQNFRVFKDKTTFKMKPMTILTGPNNSGKSSLNKAILVLKYILSQTKIENSNIEFPLDLKPDPDIKIGNFKDLIPDKSDSPTIEYIFHYKLGHAKIPVDLSLKINTNYSYSFGSKTNSYHHPVLEEVKLIFEKTVLLRSSLKGTSFPNGSRSTAFNFIKPIFPKSLWIC